MRTITGLVVACVGLCAMVVSLRADDQNNDKALRSKLVGTWRPVSMKYNGRVSDLPTATVTYKHVTPVGFTWLSYSKDTGKMYQAAGGRLFSQRQHLHRED